MKYSIGQELTLKLPTKTKITGSTISKTGVVSYQTSSGQSYPEDALAKLFDVEPFPRDKPTEKHTYKTGDKVKVISRFSNCAARVGDVVTLTDRARGFDDKNGDAWHYAEHRGYIQTRDIELYIPTVREVKRPAKVGEWVKMVDCMGGDLTAGSIHKCTADRMFDNEWCCSLPYHYVVLEGYAPEKQEEKPKYWSGKVVCVDSGGYSEYWTVGQPYSVENGVIFRNDGSRHYSEASKPEEIKPNHSAKFIELKGEQPAKK